MLADLGKHKPEIRFLAVYSFGVSGKVCRLPLAMMQMFKFAKLSDEEITALKVSIMICS